jgi:hypothetical protein
VTDVRQSQQTPGPGLAPIILRIDKPHMLPAAILCGLCVIGGILIIPTRPVMGVVGVIVMGCAAVRGAFMLRGKGTYLELTADHLAQFEIGRQVFSVPWAAVRDVRIGWPDSEPLELSKNKRVFIDYWRDNRAATFSILSRMFGPSAEELMALIARYRERAHAQAPLAALETTEMRGELKSDG